MKRTRVGALNRRDWTPEATIAYDCCLVKNAGHKELPMGSVPLDSMSPFEYFEHLRESHFQNPGSEVAEDVCDVLAASLLGALPENQRVLLDCVHIGVLPTMEPNAMVIAVPSGGEIIAIDYGMMTMLVALNKVLLCRLNSLGFEPCLAAIDAAHKAAGAVRSLYDKETAIPRWPVSPRRMLVASGLANIQVAFVIAHELAHLALHHLDALREETESFNEPSRVRELEFAADARASELVVASFVKSHDPLISAMDSVLAQAGVDTLFTYLAFIDALRGRDPGDYSGDSTHPSPQERKDAVRERFWRRLPEQARSLAVEAETHFGGFLTLICDEARGFFGEIGTRNREHKELTLRFWPGL